MAAYVNAQGGKYGNALQAAAYGGNVETWRRMLMHRVESMATHCKLQFMVATLRRGSVC